VLSTWALNLAARKSRRRSTRQGGEQYAQYARSSRPLHLNQRTKVPERLISLKNLSWRFSDPANLSRNSVPDFQPCGQGSYYEAQALDACSCCGIKNQPCIRRRQDASRWLFVYNKLRADAQPLSIISRNNSRENHRSRMNTGDFAARKPLAFRLARSSGTDPAATSTRFPHGWHTIAASLPSTSLARGCRCAVPSPTCTAQRRTDLPRAAARASPPGS